MTATLAGPEVEALTDAYRDCLVAAGMFAGHPVTSVARSFFARTGPDGWKSLSLSEQCAQSNKDRRVVGWLMVTGRLAGTADYLTRSRLGVGEMASRYHPEFYSRFCATAALVGRGIGWCNAARRFLASSTRSMMG